jgi:hypothetical protein
MKTLGLAAALFVLALACAGNKAFGSQESNAVFAKRAKAVIEAGLKDPSSVQYKDLAVYRSADSSDRALCGSLNAKNSYGAYVGFKRFWVDAKGNVRFEGPDESEYPPELFSALRMSYCEKILLRLK